MATIKISDLRPVGVELFCDSESYLNDLTDADMNMAGGFITTSSGACLRFSVQVAQVTWQAYQAGRRDRRNDNVCYAR